MRTPKYFLPLLGICFIFCCFSCSNEIVDPMPEQASVGSDQPVNHRHLIELLGFDSRELEDLGSSYLVEGDIEIPKKGLDDNIETRHTYYGKSRMVAWPDRIRVSMSNDLGSDWSKALDKAITAWNSVPDCKITISRIDPVYTPNLAIVRWAGLKTADNAKKFVSARIPDTSGNVGDTIRINPAYRYGSMQMDEYMKITVMVHLLGHAMGFGHTNSGIGLGLTEEDVAGHAEMPIPGAAANDPNSVMSRNCYYTQWNGFTPQDVLAIQAMYSSLPLIPSKVNILLDYDPGNVVQGASKRVEMSCTDPGYTVSDIRWSTTATLTSGQGTGSAVFRFSQPGVKSISCEATIKKSGYQPKYVSETFTIGVYQRVPVVTRRGDHVLEVGEEEEFYIEYSPIGSQIEYEWAPSGALQVKQSGKKATVSFATPGTHTVRARAVQSGYTSDYGSIVVEVFDPATLPVNNITAKVVSTGAGDPSRPGFGYVKLIVFSQYPVKSSLRVTFTINIALSNDDIEEEVAMYLPLGSSSWEYTYFTPENYSPQDATIYDPHIRINGGKVHDAYYRYVPHIGY